MALEHPDPRDQKYTKEVTATAGNTSAPIIIPGWVERVSVVVVPGGGGTALVQFTVDPEITVDSDPGSVDWVDWDAGSVAIISGFTAKSAITAVRVVATIAAAVLKIAGNRIKGR